MFSQNQNLPSTNENGTTLNVLYRKDFSGKIYANTRGYGFLIKRSKHVTAKTRSFYEVGFQTLNHPKEVNSQGESENKRRFVYGKLNTVFLLRGGIGLQNILFQKGDIKAVEIRYSYSIGPVFAFAKPYYLQIYKNSEPKKIDYIKFDSESFPPDSGNIIGRGGYAKGLSEMKIYPGLCGKFDLSFEYAPYTNLIRAIETGIWVEYFPKAIPMMAFNPTEHFIITFHVGFVFGRKWF
ncbi:hypothetical protein [Aurantibacillus circumpalustris]|uniref:hypothetical protein n=1 Tax=Aurantibacillus circumpalustris TaxID=3036359 RepID=UPI00295A843A|nr:hypothetical protein [Aurantibacillus circumpalustris]